MDKAKVKLQHGIEDSQDVLEDTLDALQNKLAQELGSPYPNLTKVMGLVEAIDRVTDVMYKLGRTTHIDRESNRMGSRQGALVATALAGQGWKALSDEEVLDE